MSYRLERSARGVEVLAFRDARGSYHGAVEQAY